ncbi:MAG: hypothetical protein ABL308_09960 [Oceanicaulis sp.]
MLALLAMTALGAAAPADEDSIETALSAMADAWTSGRLAQAGDQAQRALDLIGQSDCPVRPDAAVAGIIAGVAAAGTSRSHEMHFWTASRVAELSGVELPQEYLDLIELTKAEPGRDPALDRAFVRSPYFAAREGAGDCSRPYVGVDLLDQAPPDAFPVIAFLERRDRLGRAPRLSWRHLSNAVVVYVYPPAAADLVDAALSSLAADERVALGPVAVFDPCAETDTPDAFGPVCLPGSGRPAADAPD